MENWIVGTKIRFRDPNTGQKNPWADWQRTIRGGHEADLVRINGVLIAQSAYQNLFDAIRKGDEVAEEANIRAFFEQAFLSHIKDKGTQDAAITFLFETLHQGGYKNFTSAALTEALGSSGFSPTSMLQELTITPTKNGFTLVSQCKVQKITNMKGNEQPVNVMGKATVEFSFNPGIDPSATLQNFDVTFGSDANSQRLKIQLAVKPDRFHLAKAITELPVDHPTLSAEELNKKLEDIAYEFGFGLDAVKKEFQDKKSQSTSREELDKRLELYEQLDKVKDQVWALFENMHLMEDARAYMTKLEEELLKLDFGDINAIKTFSEKLRIGPLVWGLIENQSAGLLQKHLQSLSNDKKYTAKYSKIQKALSSVLEISPNISFAEIVTDKFTQKLSLAENRTSAELHSAIAQLKKEMGTHRTIIGFILFVLFGIETKTLKFFKQEFDKYRSKELPNQEGTSDPSSHYPHT